MQKEVHVFNKALRKAILPILALGLTVSGPAHADFSDGYKFLDAVKKKDGEKVEKALDGGSSQIINTKDNSTGETALQIVTARRDTTWLGYLIAKGAKLDVADDRGRTALEIAVNLGWREGAELLLNQGASPDPVNNAGETPLIFAVHRKDTTLIKMLLQSGANPDRADNSGRSARDYASIEGGGPSLVSVIDGYVKKNPVKAKPKSVYGPTL
ncbi:ankyrin [Novosphingobium sp. Rr 2-17]|uniref:ankyrin repeat domain-containing protein n=1 Tax=Novosphingobium sp. Rr 2-17 TaxID=555793 RepID=UPI0002698E5F|nr:ankyrin repeat domain-containing protein [Novosphingobium sp. Rr 2-17]EIZ80923.1 ankyrin [Novosphingobium sp. Rr 2-17]